MSPSFKSLRQIQEAIAAGQLDCETLVEHYLGQIDQTHSLNAYLAVYADEALERARALDAKYRRNPSEVGKLHGMVVSLKDVFCHKDHEVSAASRMLTGFRAPYDATVVKRLLDEDAIIIGRTNCDEFAMGSTTENSAHGPTRNAADPERVPGGSSGGSAVAVQTDTCLVSVGSDTGGSVRQPAAWCGVVGFKPTYGRIPRHGLIAYASSFDSPGLIGHSPDDIARVLAVVAGPDDYDATALQEPPPPWPAVPVSTDHEHPVNTIGYIPETLDHPGLDPHIRESILAHLQHLEKLGHSLRPVSFEYLDYLIPTYYVLTTAEASSNLSRYDGVRYGYRSPRAKDIDSLFRFSRSEGFGTEVKRRIMLGTFVLSAGYYDAYFARAQKARRLIVDAMQGIFDTCELLVMPTTPCPPPRIGELDDDPVRMYLSDIYTVLANLCGIPAISIPIGSGPEGLPVGVQYMAAARSDAKVLAFAADVMNRLGSLPSA